MKDIKGYTALVTGGTSGMGLEYCRQLAAKGCNLLIVSIQREELETVPKEISEQYGVSATGLYMDLSKETAAQELWDYCQEKGMEIDILINNAGMFFFAELTPESRAKANTMLQLHIMTPTKLVMLFGEAMKQRRKGYILNMSSLAAMLPTPGITFYSATKAYLKNFSKSMYFEMRPYNVGVTTVCPGAVATPLYRLKPSLMKLGVNIGVITPPKRLVRWAIRGMLHKRHVVKPGAMNYYLPVLIGLLPNWLEMKICNKFRR